MLRGWVPAITLCIVGCGADAAELTVGGEVSRLVGSVMLVENGSGQSFVVEANGPFTFPNAVADGLVYHVVVAQQPDGQTCTVTSGDGTVAGASVTDVVVECTGYYLGVEVTGLIGATLGVFDGETTLDVVDSGIHWLDPIYVPGDAYGVEIAYQPDGHDCAVITASGVFVDQDVTVQIDCAPRLSLGGTISGMTGGSVTLMNGSDLVVVDDNGPFEFDATYRDGTSYAVEVTEHPPGQTCGVASGDGVFAGTDVTNVTVACSDEDVSLAALVTTPGGLAPAFSPTTLAYTLSVPADVGIVQINATPTDPLSTLSINGVEATAGVDMPVALPFGAYTIPVEVQSPGGSTGTYAIDVTRLAPVGTASRQYVKPADPIVNGAFGQGVAIDGNTLVVGAPGSTFQAVGAVYVFTRAAPSSAWYPQAKLVSPLPDAYAFGSELAIDGDRLAIGSPGHPQGDFQSYFGAGRVFVFRRSGATWSLEHTFEGTFGHGFGQGLALQGDTLVVGAPHVNSVRRFVSDGIAWSEAGALPLCNEQRLGYDVALDGDTIAMSAPNTQDEDPAGPPPGAVCVLTTDGTTWTPEATLQELADGHLGFELDLDDDLLVMAVSQGDLSSDFGFGFHTYERTGTTWTDDGFVGSGTPGDAFGCSLDLDGLSLLVGAREASSAAGAAYRYTRSAGNWSAPAALAATNPDAGDRFGASVALSGGTLAIGAPGEDSGSSTNQADNSVSDAGAVYTIEVD